jgi:hypothetical protein
VEVSGTLVFECNAAENAAFQTSANTSSSGGGGWLITTTAREFSRVSEMLGLLIILGILIFGIAGSKRKLMHKTTKSSS